MSNNHLKEQLQAQLDAAQETIQVLNKRVRRLESNEAQSPFHRQLQSYQQRIAKKNEALAKVRNWFELIVKNSMDAIVRLDAKGKIQSWNPAAEHMFGYKESEALGLLMEDTLLPKRLHAAHLKHFYRHLNRGSGALMNKCIEGMAQCKNGSEIPVEFVGSVVKQGDILAYVVAFRDISQRKAAEQALRTSHDNLESLVEERTGELRDLAAILEQTISFVGVADLQGNIRYVNPSGRKLTGIAPDTPLDNLGLEDFYDSDTCRMLVEEIFPQILEQGIVETECAFVAQDRADIPTASVFMSLPSRKGQPDRLAVIARDLRKENALQQQVEHVDRLESLGVLAGGIAHDFNNILAAVIGNVGLAARKLDPHSPAQGHLQRIEQSSLQAANLCKQMLAYSGKSSFIIKPVNLTDLILEMLPLLNISIDKKVVLTCHLSETLPLMDADITQMQQIIMNLIINASEAIDHHHGTVVVTTHVMQVDEPYLQGSLHKQDIQVGRYIYLEVSDSGCGMDVDTQKKIFDPFFTTKFTGRGLGMSAVLGIVNGHHGILRIHSELNKGTTFRLAFPISSADEVVPTATKSTKVQHHASGLVLVIDDEETIREMAGMLLEDMGYTVVTAVDGKDGLEKFQENDAFVGVILDMTMPHMNGDECFRALRKIDPEVQVILSSGYSKEDATDHFHGKDLADFIQKPYQIDYFQKTVLACFNKTD
ncbi:MAG: PAS domain S-box protein [Mariprofundaceae bacterium]